MRPVGGANILPPVEKVMKRLPKNMDLVNTYLEVGPGHLESVQIDLDYAKRE